MMFFGVEFFIVLIGLCFGSFLNVVIYRLPENKSIVFPSSTCPKCNNKLKTYHNIPVLSWIFLKGKCAFCKNKISIQYPIIELLVAFIFYLCFKDLIINDIYDLIFQMFLALSLSLLLALSIIDLRYLAVPAFTLMLSLIFALIYKHDVESFLNAISFAGSAYLLKSLLESIINLKNKEEDFVQVMGEGDIEVFAVIGCILGVQAGLFAIFLSAVLALPCFMYFRIKGNENIKLPYIPFLSLALALVLFIPYLFEMALDFIS